MTFRGKIEIFSVQIFVIHHVIKIKEMLVSPPILRIPIQEGKFLLERDKSTSVVEAELYQR